MNQPSDKLRESDWIINMRLDWGQEFSFLIFVIELKIRCNTMGMRDDMYYHGRFDVKNSKEIE